MPYTNKSEKTGYLGRYAEIKKACTYTVAEFSVAVKRGKDKDTDWFDVVLWDPWPEQIAKLKKGACVQVVGPMYIDKWEKDGVKYSKPKIHCRRYSILFVDTSRIETSPVEVQPAVETNLAERLGAPNDFPF
jgi:single-stranded DNA-binding protein